MDLRLDGLEVSILGSESKINFFKSISRIDDVNRLVRLLLLKNNVGRSSIINDFSEARYCVALFGSFCVENNFGLIDLVLVAFGHIEVHLHFGRRSAELGLCGGDNCGSGDGWILSSDGLHDFFNFVRWFGDIDFLLELRGWLIVYDLSSFDDVAQVRIDGLIGGSILLLDF